MSFSGVTGCSATVASRYTCGSLPRSIAIVIKARLPCTRAPEMVPTGTPATLTGWP